MIAVADLAAIVSQQHHEMELVRAKVYTLEQTQLQIKQKYVQLSLPGGEMLTDNFKDTKRTLQDYDMNLTNAADQASPLTKQLLPMPTNRNLPHKSVMAQAICSVA